MIIPCETMEIIAKANDIAESWRDFSKDSRMKLGNFSGLAFKHIWNSRDRLDFELYGGESSPSDAISAYDGFLYAIAYLLLELEQLEARCESGELNLCECGSLLYAKDAVVDAEGVVLCPRCAGMFKKGHLAGEFLRDLCMLGATLQVTPLRLHEALVAWCSAVKGLDARQVPSVRALSAAVDGYPIQKVNRKGGVVWHGIGFRPDWQERIGMAKDGAA